MFKNFLVKKMLKAQGVPEAQVDMVLGMMEKDPGLFQTIAKEIQDEIKAGKGEQSAALEVLGKYQDELKKLT